MLLFWDSGDEEGCPEPRFDASALRVCRSSSAGPLSPSVRRRAIEAYAPDARPDIPIAEAAGFYVLHLVER